MIVFASRTGNIKYIIDKLQLPSIEISDELEVKESYLIFTYTDALGEIPNTVKEFMKNNHSHCKGVIVSGNSNFGTHVFCGAGDKLSEQYNIPIIRKIELRGFQHDYDSIIEQYNKIVKGA